MNSITTSRRVTAGLLLTTVLAACGSTSSPLARPTESTARSSTSAEPALPATPDPPISGLPDGGPGDGTPVRFVILTQPGAQPVDVVEGADPSSGRRVAKGLERGTVTDYFPDGPEGLTLVSADGSTVSTIFVDAVANHRHTVVVGAEQYGQYAAETLDEDHGHVVIDGAQPATGNTATIVSDGYGLDQSIADASTDLRLGTSPKHCVAADGDDVADPNDGGLSLSTQTSPIRYSLPAGATDLVWLTDVSCATAETAALHVDLRAGADAYVLPWMASTDHMRTLYVPVDASSAGSAGVVDSDDGPTFIPENNSTIVDDSTDDTTDTIVVTETVEAFDDGTTSS